MRRYKRYFHRTRGLTGKDELLYTEYRRLIDGIGDPIARRISEHMGKNAIFLTIDRDARPIYLALKKLKLNTKLTPVSTDMLPEKFRHDIKEGKLRDDESLEGYLRENFYFDSDPETKKIDQLLNSLLKSAKKDQRIVLIDSGYHGTIPRFLKKRLELAGYTDIHVITWYRELTEKAHKNALRELEQRIDARYGRIKSINETKPEYYRPPKDEYAKSDDLYILALADEILEKIEKKKLQSKSPLP